MEKFIQVVTTTAKKQDAESIAEKVLEKRLAGCVQICQGSSLYRWQGKIAKDDECIVTIKSRLSLFPALSAFIREIHPYEVPEIIATEIIAGSEGYLSWLDSELEK